MGLQGTRVRGVRGVKGRAWEMLDPHPHFRIFGPAQCFYLPEIPHLGLLGEIIRATFGTMASGVLDTEVKTCIQSRQHSSFPVQKVSLRGVELTLHWRDARCLSSLLGHPWVCLSE